jgi:hypothetical protein
MVDYAAFKALASEDLGDPRPLNERLRDRSVSLTIEERNYLADQRDGKFKRPRNRPKSHRTEAVRLWSARYVLFLVDQRQMLEKQAVPLAAKRFCRSEASVRKDLQFVKDRYGLDSFEKINLYMISQLSCFIEAVGEKTAAKLLKSVLI